MAMSAQAFREPVAAPFHTNCPEENGDGNHEVSGWSRQVDVGATSGRQ
jgi:hypothetical protein